MNIFRAVEHTYKFNYIDGVKNISSTLKSFKFNISYTSLI